MTEHVRPSGLLAPLPGPLCLSVGAWLAAVAFGIAETVVRLVLPDPPTAGGLVARSVVYALVVALVLSLTYGHGAIRTAVAVLLGGVGTVSLTAEPVRWLAAGGSPMAFLAAADDLTLLVVWLRMAHLLAVLVALAAMFHPRVNAFFRERRSAASAAYAAVQGPQRGDRR
jgi:hypothetical protein